VLRNLIIKQTWSPTETKKGESVWFSDANGVPLSDTAKCIQNTAAIWLPLGPVPGPEPGKAAPKSTAHLMKPAIVSYPPSCGVTIRLNMEPAEK